MKFTPFIAAALMTAAALCGAELELRPLFHSCGIYFKTEIPKDCTIVYREKGTSKWLPAFAPTYDKSYDSKFRTSIVDLKPDTEYEVKAEARSGRMINRAEGTFRTWAEQVPIAKRIVLKPEQVKEGFTIKDKGKPDGWILYTAAPGTVIKGYGKRQALMLDKAEYVIVENLAIEGGDNNAIYLNNCKYVRLRNLDISRWCDPANWTYDKGTGRFRNKTGRHLGNKNAIYINRGFGQVIERCYIHDPLMSSNNWRYGHPDGPQGIAPMKPQSTVIRYNDICGSDLKWWNDGIAGNCNFDLDGGLNKDCDVYGNFIAFANDDCIELDGGQQNVRCFRNHFENTFVGISVQGCMTGPSFVFENRIVDLADEFMGCNTAFKTADLWVGHYAAAHFFNNTTDQKRSILRYGRNYKIVAQNNIMEEIVIPAGGVFPFLGMKWDNNLVTKKNDKSNIGATAVFTNPERGIYTLKKNSPGYGKGKVVPGLNKPNPHMGAPENLELPCRPFPLTLTDGRKALFTVKNKQASAPVQFVIKATAPVKFEVRKSEDSDWYEVTPSKLALKAGEKATVTVKVKPEKMNSRINYRSVFFLRSPEGFSRPITVMAVTDYKYPVRREGTQHFKPKAGAPFPKAKGSGVVFEDQTKKYQIEFTLKEKTGVFITVTARAYEPIGQHDSVLIGMDKEEPSYCPLRSIKSSHYTEIRARSYVLPAGKHTLTIIPRESLDLRQVTLVTDVRALEKR